MTDVLNSPLGAVLGALIGVGVALIPALGPQWWLTRRDQRRWDRGEAARRRQWAEEDRRQALQQQLRDLERQIWEESLPDWQREAIEDGRRRQREIRAEARRRLGLAEEEEPGEP
jgi:hypothetical protein